MWLTPSEGIKIGEFTFHMPTFQEMILDDEIECPECGGLIKKD